MLLQGIKVGFAITSSFCTIKSSFTIIEDIIKNGGDVLPILSENSVLYETRFLKYGELENQITILTGKKPFKTIVDVEPIGPKNLIDVLLIAPCTGNTLSKISNSITDSSITMACKSHLRNNKPVILSIATNDGLSGNAKNIGYLLNKRNMYFVPFFQDDYINKPNSLMSDTTKVIDTILEALKGHQLQPVLIK